MKDNFVNRPLKKKLNRQNMVSRIEKLEGKTAIKPSSATRIEDLSEITDEINAAVIRAIDVEAGVVRMIMSGEDIYDGEAYNIHANLAGFNDAGEPTVWIDAQDGILRGGGGNVGMDEDGIWVVSPTAYLEVSEYKFVDSAGNRLCGLGSYEDETILHLNLDAFTNEKDVTTGMSARSYGKNAMIFMSADGGSGQAGLTIVSHATGGMDATLNADIIHLIGQVTITNSATAGDGNFFGTTPAALADDTAISFSPTKLFGILCLNMRTAATGESGLFAYRCSGSGARMEIISAGSHIETTTGVLSGTTGTDGKLTLSAHTDGNIYIENRRGAGRSFTYTLLGA